MNFAGGFSGRPSFSTSSRSSRHVRRAGQGKAFSPVEMLERRVLLTVPAGFVETQWAGNLSRPISMTAVPDGRILVAEQGGAVKVVSATGQTSTLYQVSDVYDSDEAGLLAVAVDPHFEHNGYLYLNYTTSNPVVHDRVVRITVAGDAVVPDSQVTILELDPVSSGAHHSGMMRFGSDGLLYIGVGDDMNPANSQSLATTKGKILRVHKDGVTPDDNPFFNDPNVVGKNKLIWALGLRNPVSLDFHRTDGRLFIGEVGQQSWEEINQGFAGGNYGWPSIEGMRTSQPAPVNYHDPVHTYPWGFGNPVDSGCAITGGAFYDPVNSTFPSIYQDTYFFADFCRGNIKSLNTTTGQVTSFGTGFHYIVGLEVGADGALYVLERREYKTNPNHAGARILRITHGDELAPVINVQPQSQTAARGMSVVFTVQASANPPATYQWRLNGEPIPGATDSSLLVEMITDANQNAVYDVIVTNDIGSVTSLAATLTVDDNDVPVGIIVAPGGDYRYTAGDVIQYQGVADDIQDGELPGSAFTWWADLHHDAHSHPAMAPTTGSSTGQLEIPRLGETSHNVWYRLYMQVTDSHGATHTTYTDILPIKTEMTFATSVPGFYLLLDGRRVTAPEAILGVAGVTRSIEAPETQMLDGVAYDFVRWSDDGDRVRTFNTPGEALDIVAEYAVSAVQPVYLSDLDWVSASSPYTGIKRDLSTNGSPMRIGGQSFAKGLGVHSPSSILYRINGAYTRFSAQVGIDDSVGDGALDGSVVFQVWGDGVLLAESSLRTGAAGAELLEVDISGISELRLVTTVGQGGDYKDHANWGNAQVFGGTGSGGPVVTLPTVTIAGPTASLTEGAGGTFTLARTGDLSQPLTVHLAYSGTALAGVDYTALPATFTFEPGAASGTLNLATIDDAISEPTEMVIVTIISDAGYVIGGAGVASATIIDNDSVVVEPPVGDFAYLSDLNWASATSPYSGIKKDQSSNGSALTIGGQSFTKGLGVHSPSTVVYNLNRAYATFTAYVGIDDSVGNLAVHGSAVFQVWGDGVLLAQSARRTGAHAAEYMVVDIRNVNQLTLITTVGGDNDYKDHANWADARLFTEDTGEIKPTVSIVASGATVAEGASASFTLSRTGDLSQPLTVNLTYGGAATPGVDYTALPSTFTFDVGVGSGTLNLLTIDDADNEPNEAVTVTITAGDDYIIGAAGAASATIIDNDSVVVEPPVGDFVHLSDLNWTSAISPYHGAKKDQNVTGRGQITIGGEVFAKGIGVHASSELVYTLGGQYTRFTAMVGIDDSVGNGANDGSAQFLVYVDGVLKATSSRRTGAMGAELIDVDVSGGQTLRLVANTGGLPGDNDYKDHANWADAKLYTGSPAVDRPVVTIAANDASVEEGMNGSFTLTRTGDLTETLAVQLSFGGSATSGSDYTGTELEYVFAEGEATILVPFQTVDDDIYEGPETIVASVRTSGSYAVGSPANATVTIEDNDEPATGAPDVYLSDLNWTSATSPYHSAKKDQNVTGRGQITIGGEVFAKGIGVHASSELVYNLGGQYGRFTAMVGIDDSVGNGANDGSAQFLVYVDGVLKATSSRRTGAMGAELIDVEVSGGQTLRLVVNTGGQPGDNDYKDHANWADAKLFGSSR